MQINDRVDTTKNTNYLKGNENKDSSYHNHQDRRKVALWGQGLI